MPPLAPNEADARVRVHTYTAPGNVRGVHIKILYNIVADMTLEDRMRRLASQKLIRWGFHPQRRCLLPVICRDLLVRVEGTDEVFPGVDMRDKLHGLFSFFSPLF